MKKPDLQKLIDDYDGKNAGSLFRKGIRKRLFGLRTTGIKDLSNFLNLPQIKSLSKNEEISGDSLSLLLDILALREDRIHGTSRSYENYPDKATNQVYHHIYQLLWHDLAEELVRNNISEQFEETVKGKEKEFEKPDEKLHNKIVRVLLQRENTSALSEYEKDVKSGHNTVIGPMPYYKLGMAYTKGGKLTSAHADQYRINRLDDAEKKVPDKNAEFYHKMFDFGKQKIDVFFSFISGNLSEVKIIPQDFVTPKNSKKAIEWLELGSKRGDAECSYALAQYYAGINISIKNNKPDTHKAIQYLKLTSKQDQKLYIGVLTEGGRFGEIDVPKPPNFKKYR